MLRAKKILFVLLTLSLVFAIASCGGSGGNKDCDVCVDEDGDSVCDVCKKEIQIDDVVLFEDGEPTFQIVLSDDLSDSMKQTVNTQIKMMLQKEHDVEIDVVTEGDSKDVEIPTEILIGEVTSRGERYRFDGHTLGMEGYAYKIVGTKILVNGGSDDMLTYAIKEFADDILAADDITALTMTKDDVVVEIQDDYSVTSLKMSGEDMWGYTIAADLTRKYYEETALKLQSELYKRTGYWFKIVDVENATEKSIVMKHVDGVTGESSYKASVKGKQLVIECAYDNKLYNVTQEFAASAIYMKEGEVDLKDTSYTKDISVVYYDEFEAKGDGETDDFVAIYNTHVFANECGQTVKAKPDATYYIFNTRQLVDGVERVTTIPIRTNTDWQGANFLIDDTNVSTMSGGLNKDMSGASIFTVFPDEEHEKYVITDEQLLARISAEGGIHPGTEKINLGLGYEAMIIPYCSSHKVFRRKGYSAFAGIAQQEIIVIDAEGNVSKETPIMFNYDEISSIDVYRFDSQAPLTVKNATFTTLDTRINHMVNGVWKGTYIHRGINVSRSYTTLENVEHIVKNGFTLADRVNGIEGSITKGFFQANYANHVTFKDCIIPARMSYTGSSTYNINADHVNKFILDGCVQSNFWITVDPDTYEIKDATVYDENEVGRAKKASPDAITAINTYFIDGDKYNLYYGFCGTNYCKNLEYHNSTLSRIDAHQGLYHGKVINTNIADLELTGNGNFEFRDSNFYHSYIVGSPSPFLYMRSDYGYTWDGEITIKNVKAYTIDDVNFQLVRSSYSNWYFGYTCAFPNLVIDNLDFYSVTTGEKREAGYTVSLTGFAGVQKHLLESTSNTIIGIVDDDAEGEDGYGYIDEPLYDRNRDGHINDEDLYDLDGNGVIGETSLRVEDYKYLDDGSENWNGVTLGVKVNVNITKPPKYVKILNNDDGYKFSVYDTSGAGISDGAWYDDVETYGGFFGDTRFYYGTEEDEYVVGTKTNENTGSFIFEK